jgi:hypothetical protein
VIILYHRYTSLKQIQQQHSHAVICDMTSRGPQPWIRFSPFYPHSSIPVPFSPGYVSASVEGIWQGLKVFERANVDPSKFAITTMKHLKRSTRTYGEILGHRQGVEGERLLAYVEARFLIYLPAYAWVLKYCVQDLLMKLKRLERERPLVFLDYETNCDITVTTRPLSHAGLVKLYLEDTWPSLNSGSD